ncbi:type II secretion system F family protein [Arthrobacter sp. CJ23]|uniref:type II secretion system F family protein n=1 Tax=Arthrobacter sp. CJ23 TaxID=2972479 RepID=UPI00215BBBF7|nr:hypothetical protein [Arthrobacter sp. CJ23]UVJ38842.1 hypothetical protein NVV90_16725 [Arthrobacter sp. CJ23]
MTVLLVLVLAATAWLVVGHRRGRALRVRRALRGVAAHGGRTPWARGTRGRQETLPLMVLVQQLAALLRGGRSPSKLWAELWIVHAGEERTASGDGSLGVPAGGTRGRPSVTAASARLSQASLDVLAAARAASALGASTADAIRGSLDPAFAQRGGSTAQQSRAERRIWGELAACLDVAETSGCPLADILTRFCAQLEAEDDADAARQTALAGPKATVRLLSWLPVLGLGLGMVLGVDPLGILLGNAVGVAALVAGVVLTVAGRVWSTRLVSSAAGGP